MNLWKNVANASDSCLTENPNVTVGIVEAGKYRINDPLVDMPTVFFQTFEREEYNWCMYVCSYDLRC